MGSSLKHSDLNKLNFNVFVLESVVERNTSKEYVTK